MNDDVTRVSQQNEDGSWGVAVPFPFYNGLLWIWRGLYVCECGAKFWRESSYEKHYRENYMDDDHGMPDCGYCGRTGCIGSCQL